MSSSTNISINSRSMNGIITISDGAGTTIENGVVDTDSLITDTMTSTNMISTNMIVPRINTNLISLLGSTINLTTLCQNLNFNTTNRAFEIWDDASTGQIFELNVTNANNSVYFNTLIGYFNAFTQLKLRSPDLQLSNSNVSFPNSNVSFNSNLPTTTITTGFANNNFITKAYGDSVYHPLGSYASLPGNNIYTGTNQFNTNLPTSTLTPTLGTQLITKTYGDSTYPLISGNNAFTGTNTFNSNLPTSTISSATLGTQFITRAIADGRFGQLATANTFTSQNTFQNGILPCTTLTTTNIQLGGNNQLQYRQATSLNNISIGNNTLRGDSNPLGVANNTGSRNIGISHDVLQNIDTGSDNIFIGYQAGSGAQPTRVVSVNPSRCIAIGTFSQAGTNLYATDAISIGYNSLRNASGPAVGNICIGSNVGNGLNFQNQNVLIGNNCAPTVNDNGVLAIGANCMALATGSFNSGTSVGASSGYNNAGGQGGCFIGALAGYANTTGYYNSCLGLRAGYSSIPTINNTICIGYNSKALNDFECVFGGEASTEQVFLTLPQKQRLRCNQLIGSVATYNISWRSNENVIINSATTTQINLPQATDATTIHIGAVFNIIRTSGAISNCIISAFGTETIFYSGSASTSVPIDSWVNSISFCCVNNVAGSPMWAVCRYNDRVTLATDSRRLQTLTDSSNVNYPVCFTTIATTGYNNVYANSSLTYNPSTSLMTVQNLTVGGTLNAGTLTATNSAITNKTGDTNTFNINFSQGTSGNLPICASTELKYTPSTTLLEAPNILTNNITIKNNYKIGTVKLLLTNATVLPDLPILYQTYFWTDSNPTGTTDTIITLPTITNDMIGCVLTFRRLAYATAPTTVKNLIIKTQNTFGLTITARDSCTTISYNTNYTLLDTSVSRLGTFAQIVAYTTTSWFVLQ